MYRIRLEFRHIGIHADYRDSLRYAFVNIRLEIPVAPRKGNSRRVLIHDLPEDAYLCAGVIRHGAVISAFTPALWPRPKNQPALPAVRQIDIGATKRIVRSLMVRFAHPPQ